MGESNKKRRLDEATSAPRETQITMDSPKKETVQEEKASTQPKRTLFVRSLPASATTESLTEYFSQSYVIKHAIAVNDPETKQCKGYGFVTFADLEDAQAAVKELNGSTFEGKKIRVDYAQPRHREIDENLGKSVPSAAAVELKKQREQQRADTQPPKLIVRNLPWSIKTPEDLAVHFRSFGKVKFVTLPKKGDQLAGFGFVVLRGKKNAEKALQAVNGKEVDGRTLAVDWAVDKETWENLQKDATKEEDNKEEAGSNDVEMADGAEAASDNEEEEDEDEDMDDEEDEDDEDLDEDDEDVDEEEDDGEDYGEEKEDERNASTIFIRNLPFTCTDESLYEHFTQFGPLRYARIVVDPETERPRGTGFVCFWKMEDAASCVRDAPKQQDTLIAEKDKGKKSSTTLKHSILQNENSDPSGRYTLDGRVLQVARAVSKSQATRLEEEGVSKRLVRDTDKRRLFLLQEGTISPSASLYKKLSPSEIKMREDSFKQRQNFIRKNPALHLSLTRLSVRNIPRHVTSKDLKQLARQAVVGFAKDAKEGLRQPLSKDELKRSAEAMKEAEQHRKEKGKGIVRQTKIVYESRDGSKIGEETGAGRSRGYGFIEYYTHRHALMGLRWLNGHAVDMPKTGSEDVKDKKKRLIVEFAIENAQVVKRRNEQEARARAKKEAQQKDGAGPSKDDQNDKANTNGKKRKRSDSRGSGKEQNGEQEAEEENKIAKRNRIISRKRMQRKSRKGKA
ncbi:mRNA-binding ribosome biosynthesis protein NOP4 [Aspergillus clavatus NRRL 1]|uniref:Ribosome biogenesis (Nop4), putative n=1 Tax=Aspergillus clavatus (strain ATCC 1007 / CBS 513.65 / DSM 816 / NCTC 3887 / NRRL 1 / QM 1276 / 107) TaxID=344612 RepID=A1CGT7_ASPCL|nr:ribosome biogenesis (Nop4), putative [Aspergillus clavatus NRRL 1]EAW10092.1 ribosome biogenesis (Nop4), putative [Aspergillus clavatus NRRL 1]